MSRTPSVGNRPLYLPGTEERALVRPDARHLVVPRTSGVPFDGEVDYDDLVVHSQFRVYEPERPAEVRYLVYELSQRNPGHEQHDYFFKAIRVTKLTRVPRYLRQSSASGPSLVIDQQRDLLAGLREKGVVFLNLIAKAPDTQLIFAYGVSGVGATPEEAQYEADQGFAALIAQLDGLYQQLEYRPLTAAEAESLVRYQTQWDRLAMARGRPVPDGVNLSSSSALDGNRTDVESTLNQLEAFLRGMTDRNFILSLVCVPIEAEHMASAWRNLTGELSRIRSEQQGTRSLSVGVAIPLTFGQSLGKSAGNTHATAESTGFAASDALSQSVTDGTNSSQSVGQTNTQAVSQGSTVSSSVGQSTSQASAVTEGITDSVSSSVGHSVSTGQSASDSVSQGLSSSFAQTQTDGVSQSNSQSVSQSNSQSASQSNSQSVSQSAGSNWSNTMGQSTSASQGQSAGFSTGLSESVSSGMSIGGSEGRTFSSGISESESGGIDGGFPFLGSNLSETFGSSETWNRVESSNAGSTFSGTAGSSSGTNQSQTSSLSQGASWGESLGGTASETVAAANAVAFSQSQGFTNAASQGFTNSASQGFTMANAESSSVGRSLGSTSSEGLSQSTGIGQSRSTSASTSVGESTSTSRSVSASQTSSTSQAQSLSASQGVSRSETAAVSQGTSQNQALSDAYTVAMSRAASTTSSLGAVPSVGIAVSKNTFDERKRMIGDVLETQANRYMQGLEGGAFFYQLFLQCPDAETLAGASALLKSAFFGPANQTERLPQPFHTIDEFEPAEQGRLLTHAQAFTHYRRRETNTELVEPHLYSTYSTCFEVATMSHPPTAEALGLLAVHDSMPVMAMPADRADRDLTLGLVVNGERGRVSDVAFGIDADEMTHTLIAGTTGSGKTTTLMTMLSELTKVERQVAVRKDELSPELDVKNVKAGIVALDWMSNARDLQSVVEPDRFRFYSVAKPELGAFRWNPLAIPDPRMQAMEWANDFADQAVVAFSLGEFGRSLIAEFVGELYQANRLEPYPLRPEQVDDDGNVLRPAIYLDPVDRASLPADAIVTDDDGNEFANVLTCSELSRLVSMEHLATLVASKVEEAATQEGARLMGQAMRDRIQSLWRRVQYFAPGSPFAGVLTCDETLEERTCVSVSDLIDPDKGIVAVIEADGLDQTNRKFVLGVVLLALWRYGQFQGEGALNHDGQGPGTWVVLEEAHELFGPQGEEEDSFTAATRSSLYESLFRRSRALGMKLVAVVQNAGSVPTAITSNVSSVFVHRQYDEADRKRVFNLLNWNNQLGQQQREYRYLGEMALGYCIARLDAKESWLESAPVHFRTEPAALSRVKNATLQALAEQKLQ